MDALSVANSAKRCDELVLSDPQGATAVEAAPPGLLNGAEDGPNGHSQAGHHLGQGRIYFGHRNETGSVYVQSSKDLPGPFSNS